MCFFLFNGTLSAEVVKIVTNFICWEWRSGANVVTISFISNRAKRDPIVSVCAIIIFDPGHFTTKPRNYLPRTVFLYNLNMTFRTTAMSR